MARNSNFGEKLGATPTRFCRTRLSQVEINYGKIGRRECTLEEKTRIANRPSFFSHIGENPEQIWLDLCDNQDEARNLCLVFLEVCVENSQALRPVLGPEENAYVQTITSANALLQIWKGLIAHADEKVLDKARKRDPKNRSHWKLKYTNHDGGRNRGPANRVASVSCH